MASDPGRDPRADRRRWTAHRDNRPAHMGTTVVGIAASCTAEPIEIPLGVDLLDAGLPDPAVVFADFGQVHPALLSPESTFGTTITNLVLLLRIEDLFAADTRAYLRGDEGAGERIVEQFDRIGAMVADLAGRSGIEITVALPPVPAPPGVDRTDPVISLPLRRLQHHCITVVDDRVRAASAVHLIDTDALIADIGRADAHDPMKWALYRQPYSSAAWQALAGAITLDIARRTTPPPKCIVIDCDNTLWGGIVGEDGLGGIELGEDFPGRCFTEFQQSLLDRRAQGTILAICSKNEAADVDEVFDRHDAMVLRRGDVAAWRVDWRPKSDNIASIAAELNIGLDAVVFIDDSHFEVAEVRAALPEVTCLQVPEDPALLPGLIAGSGLFAMSRVTDDDRHRTEMLIAEGARRGAAERMDQGDFLASLGLRATIVEVTPEQIGRVAQLINKTNQFNLTTIRRTEADVTRLVDDDDWTVLSMQVQDDFGDYGLVGVAVIDHRKPVAVIDTLLMSCRVLGRGVETAFLATLIGHAFDRGATAIEGRYVPTRKNAQVADLYERHDFAPADDGNWRCDRADTVAAPAHIAIVGR